MISCIERGKNSPSITTLQKILGALGTDLAAFFAARSQATGRTGIPPRAHAGHQRRRPELHDRFRQAAGRWGGDVRRDDSLFQAAPAV